MEGQTVQITHGPELRDYSNLHYTTGSFWRDCLPSFLAQRGNSSPRDAAEHAPLSTASSYRHGLAYVGKFVPAGTFPV